MAIQTSQKNSVVWRLDGATVVLQTHQLAAEIDLQNPCAGLSQLVYNDIALDGFVLGITPGASPPMSERDLDDVFLRGNDLVVTYSETNQRPFSLQAYWRATVSEDGVLLLDTIISLQTDLLESFPGLAVETQLPAATAWYVPNQGVPNNGKAAVEIALAKGQQRKLPTDDSDGLLLQAANADWSYAEMTHPEDRGGGRIQRLEQDAYLLHRQLGGGFLEKGVIRRLRVRGVFLPRENDFELAVRSLAQLATEQPPLTV